MPMLGSVCGLPHRARAGRGLQGRIVCPCGM